MKKNNSPNRLIDAAWVAIAVATPALGMVAPPRAAADAPNAPSTMVAPSAAGPVAVKIDGPSTAIAGEKLYFTLQESGAVSSRAWSVLPAGSVGFDQRDGGARADFATRFAGTYVFVVSVAGVDGSVAHAFHSLELREATPAASPPAPQPSGPGPNPAGQGPDPANLIRAWALEAPTVDRRAEAAVIARALRSEAAAVAAKRNTSPDPLTDVRATCSAALGGRYAAWAPFFDQLSWFFSDMARRGAMPGRENLAAALESTAKVLEGL